jgi:hypothetical protein
MLKFMVGEVDQYSGAVLIAMALGLAVFCTTWIATRRSKRALEMEHELAKLKQNDATRLEQERIVAKWEYERKRLDQNLITSHRSNDHEE